MSILFLPFNSYVHFVETSVFVVLYGAKSFTTYLTSTLRIKYLKSSDLFHKPILSLKFAMKIRIGAVVINLSEKAS